ncbi:hypothetical protein BLNAU_15814 [Blattamonas nauphoetae]|uniref:Uncharacterized protein n=1 Tax=Blattamonas nauphoetae TaxID=2049346 RepID=A0ABQ9XG20_9EUKA|nr:hypothetical protein BLNAU_15814 [Blattamonas nauphoetae]
MDSIAKIPHFSPSHFVIGMGSQISRKDPDSQDTSLFLNWNGETPTSITKASSLFLSLISIINDGSSLPTSVEDNVVLFLSQITPSYNKQFRGDTILYSLVPSPCQPCQRFIDAFCVFFTASERIALTALAFLHGTITFSSKSANRQLLSAGLIPSLMNALQPHTLRLPEHGPIHHYLVHIVVHPFNRTPQPVFMESGNPPLPANKSVYNTVFLHTIAPSASYLFRLTKIINSISNPNTAKTFMDILIYALEVSAFSQPILDLVLSSSIPLSLVDLVFTIENADRRESAFWSFFISHTGWETGRRSTVQRRKVISRVLFSEGWHDGMAQQLENTILGSSYRSSSDVIVTVNNLFGGNVPKRE